MRKLFYEVINPTIIAAPVLFAAVGYGLSNFFPLTIEVWSALLIISVLLCAVLFRYGSAHGKFEWVKWEDDFASASLLARLASFAPYLIFVPGVIALFLSPNLQVSHHGNLHSAYVNQVLQGFTPPTNASLPGYTPNYYWLYHALLAVPVYLLNISAPQASTLLNIIGLVSTLGWTVIILKWLNIGRKNIMLAGLFAVIIVFGLNLFGIFHAYASPFFDSDVNQRALRALVLVGDPRLRNLWTKFLNYTSFAFSIAYFVTAIYACLRLLQNPFRYRYLLALLAGIGGGIFFQLGTGMFTMATFIPALLAALLLRMIGALKALAPAPDTARMTSLIQSARSELRPARLLLYGATLIPFFALMLLYYRGVSNPYSASGQVVVGNGQNLLSLAGAFYPVAIFFLFSLVYGIIRRNLPLVMLGCAVVIGGMAAYLFDIRGDNQYKFVYLSSIPLMLTVVAGLYYFLTALPTRQWQGNAVRLALAGMAVLVYVNVAYVDWFYLKTARNDEIIYQFEGRHVLSTDGVHQEVLSWLRDYTATETLVILPVPEVRYFNLLSERLPYVGENRISFIAGIPEYTERADVVETFYAPDSTFEERQQAVEYFVERNLGKPAAVIVAHDSPISETEAEQLGLERLYRGTQSDVYALPAMAQAVLMAD